MKHFKVQHFIAIFILIFFTFYFSGCAATKFLGHQQPLLEQHQQSKNLQLNQAYSLSENAFNTCIENQNHSSIPWNLPFMIAMAGITTLNITSLVVVPFAAHSWFPAGEQTAFTSSTALFLSFTLILSTGMTTVLGYTLWQEIMLQKSLEQRLNHYRRETKRAYTDRDIQQLRRLSRYILEDCRVITSLPQTTLNQSLIRDLEKYRTAAPESETVAE